MESLKLKAEKREVTGKKTRFLRRQGITPTHLIGHQVDSLTLQCQTAELLKIVNTAGMTRAISLHIDGEKQAKSVFIKEIQRHPINQHMLHVDFYQVKHGEKMRMEVPIVIIGESPAMKSKGRMIAHGITSLHVECLPEHVPSRIEVDISSLEDVEQPILVKDLVVSPEVTIQTDPEQLVVKISEVGIQAADVEADASAAAASAAAAEAAAPAPAASEETTAGG